VTSFGFSGREQPHRPILSLVLVSHTAKRCLSSWDLLKMVNEIVVDFIKIGGRQNRAVKRPGVDFI
jgi:hypothetical protein